MSAQILPVEEGLDSLAKEILAAGRTYPVFDLAKLVLGARERFNVGFKCSGEQKLYRCRKDGSVWLDKEEAMQAFWRGEWRKEFYEEVIVATDPPKGNFQGVAKCGMSGEYLGPPNYHGYQIAIVEMHRDRFAHMDLDAYKRKIQVVRDEEVVNAWLEKMSTKARYRPTGGKAPEPVVGEQPAEDAAEDPAGDVAEGATAEVSAVAEETAVVEDVVATEEAAVEEAPAAEESAATEDAPAAEEAVEGEEASVEDSLAEEAPAEVVSEASAADEVLLDDLREVERHFLEHHFAEVFHHTPKAWVPGGVQGYLLSPGLLTLLRQTVAEERRYPGRLTPMLCRQLSGRHVAVFKWRKKLKAGPARPHTVPEDIVLADRPQLLLEWLKENSGKNLEQLWKDLLPENVEPAQKHLWYHDLHWILNQGYALLLADSTLHLARKGEGEEKPGKKGAAKGAGDAAAEVPMAEVPVAEVPVAEVPVAEVPVAEVSAAEVPAADVSKEPEAPGVEEKGA